MTGLPGRHHLEYTCESLSTQEFTDFEVVVVDLLKLEGKGNRSRPHTKYPYEVPWWTPLTYAHIPLYHVPVRSTPFVDRGYVAISATKNSGALYAEGELFLFLDDCTWLPPDTLGKFYNWFCRGAFVAGLHARLVGDEYTALDSRFRILDALGRDVIDDRLVSTYGYPSCSREAFYKLNGFDEMFDGSRQLEDADFGERLQAAGFKVVLDRSVVIHEQEHLRLNAYPDDRDPARTHVEDERKWKPNLKCNGTWIFWKQDTRTGEDRWKANHRVLSAAEWVALGGTGEVCPYRKFDAEGFGFCGRHAVPLPCNWYEGRKESNMILPDAQLYNQLLPIDFSRVVPQYLAAKERYRVC